MVQVPFPRRLSYSLNFRRFHTSETYKSIIDEMYASEKEIKVWNVYDSSSLFSSNFSYITYNIWTSDGFMSVASIKASLMNYMHLNSR